LRARARRRAGAAHRHSRRLQKGKRENGKAQTVAVTVSVGCAARSGERRSPAEVLKAADQALYKAKAKGRNRVIAA
jgi:diguanylate cyclase (GGDEF)-like protein